MPNLSRDTLLALRIGSAQWLQPNTFDQLLLFLQQWPAAIDELAFFTSTTHAPLPLAEHATRCVRLAAVMAQARQHEYRVGINVLATIGHHDENLANSLDEAWPRMTDPHGAICHGSYCPGDERLLAYVNELYTLTAQAGPDFIWVDDDIRLLGHMPIRATCFCDGCVARFNEETGAAFNRATLVAALQSPAEGATHPLRRQWLEHNRQLITRLLQVITSAVHHVDPAIQLGFMSGDRFYEGYAFAEWAAALSGKTLGSETLGSETLGSESLSSETLSSESLSGQEAGVARWRPGGGFYNDDSYLGLVDKAHDIGRQVSQLPPQITVVQSEIENFPYHPLRKSAEITLLEAAAHMAAGATGIAFNILNQQPDPLLEYRPMLDGIAKMRPWYHALRAATARGQAMGVWPAWNRDIFAAANADPDWLEGNSNIPTLRRPYVLAELGLPIAYAESGSNVAAFSGTAINSFADEELRRIFAGGVLLDGAALLALAARGLDEWAGVTIAGSVAQDASEVLNDHGLNGPFAGWSRDCRQSFWPQPAYQLEVTHPKTEVLAHLFDYGQRNLGPTMTAFENSLGGRVVVAGYYPWSLLHSLAKSSQMKAICAWLSRDQLPVVVKSFAKVVVWAREGEGGQRVLVVLNAALDKIPRLTLQVLGQVQCATALDMDGHTAILPTIILPTMPGGEPHTEIIMYNLEAWRVWLIHLQPAP